jgi:hypothetical protein
VHQPQACHIVQVRDFFDSKWLGFSGKVLGALGIHGKLLTVPPFHPNRVARERHLVRAGEEAYDGSTDLTPLHIDQPSSHNLTRRAASVAPRTAFVWYSGGSALSARASLMAYVPVTGAYWQWYIAMAGRQPWRITRSKGISRAEFAMLCAHSRDT